MCRLTSSRFPIALAGFLCQVHYEYEARRGVHLARLPSPLPPPLIFLSSMSRATYCFDPFLSRDGHREARARCPPCGLPRGDTPPPTPHCPGLRPEDVVPASRIRIWFRTGMFASVCICKPRSCVFFGNAGKERSEKI